MSMERKGGKEGKEVTGKEGEREGKESKKKGARIGKEK